MPNFTGYNINVPIASKPPRNSPPNFQTNFGTNAGLIGTDHYQFTDPVNGGWHQKSTYVAQAADPGSVSGQSVHYSKVVGTSTEEFIQRDGTATAIQLTTLAGNPVAAQTGQSFLPGGIVIKWGQAVVQPSGTTVAFSPAFPNNCFQVVMTPDSNTARGLAENSINASGFRAYGENSNTTIHYIAVGN